MSKRILNCFIIALSFSLVFGPSLSLASTPEKTRRRIYSPPSTKFISSPKRTKPTTAARVQASTLLPGQTMTLLPDGRSLLIGGETPDGPQATVAISDARTGKPAPLPNGLHQARAWHSATMLPDGRVFILGGIDASGQVIGSAEIFNPEAGTFELLPATGISPRAYHTATLLTNGQVLIIGGRSAQNRTLSRAVQWDFKTNQAVTVPSSLTTARQKHKAKLLTDGNVLIEGGVDGDGNQVTAAELYNVEAQSFYPTGLSSQQTDNNVPYLAASLPGDGASDVPVDSLIALRFSKHLRVESLNSETLMFSGPEGTVETKVIPAENGKLAFITPKMQLHADATYTVSLAGATDGTSTLVSTVITFTTIGERETENNPTQINPSLTEADWVPGAENLRGNWKSNLGRSSWQDQPPLQAEPGVTAVSGQALTLLGHPLANVTIEIGGKAERTDNTGRFLVTSLGAGHHVMKIDGRTASRPGRVYGLFRVGVDVSAGKTNVLPYTIWMPKLDMVNATAIPSPTTSEVVITHPYIPGLELHLPPGTVIRDVDGQTVTQISITPVPTDRPPFPLPSSYSVPVFFTIQPGGARVIPPRARVIYPNYTEAPAGARINFWNYDPEGRGWYIYGQGTVSKDGRQVIPDPSVVVYEFNGIMISDESPNIPTQAPKSTDPGWPCRVLGLFCGGSGPGGPGNGGGGGGGGGGNPNGPNGPGAPRNKSGSGGDPVDLSTGLFTYSVTDLFLPDTLPISLTRTYRSQDSVSRAFGIGTSHPYGMFLSSVRNYQEADLITPDGGRIHYVRISPGIGYMDAVYEHTATPTIFYKSRIAWNGSGWDVTLKDRTVFVFGDFAPLQAIRDRYGNQITLTRTSGPLGNITQITSSNGRWVQLTYDGNNRVTQARDNTGRTVNYTYDASGRLWRVTDPTNGLTEYTYDASHRMLTIKDARGIVYLTNEYDAAGRITKQTQPDTNTYRFAYTLDGSGRITQTEITDQRGNVRRVTFNVDGYALTDRYAVGRPEQQTITYERQAGTNMIQSVTDSLNRRITYARDAAGYITEVTVLAGTPEAVTSRFAYEPMFNKIASVTNPLNHTTTFTYDDKGNLITATNPLNQQITFAYNTAGQIISATNPLNHITRFTYDGADLIEVRDPLNRSVNRFVDGAGRLWSITNPLGQTVRYEYDPLNRLTRVTDPLQGVTSFAYDPNGNLLSVTDARSGVTSYTYDNMDRVTTRRDPLLRDITYQYNADGTLRQATDRKSQVTNYSYDGLNRLTQVTFNDASTITYTYDAGNRLTQIIDSLSGTITYVYDNLNRLTSKTTPRGTVNYIYDAAGRRTSMTVAGQPTVNYTYDNANRLTQVTKGSETVTIGYDAAGRRTSLTLPNGVVTEYAYDAASQLTGVTYKRGATVLGDLLYEYDAAGRRTKMGGSYARTGLPQAVTSATYNAANQQTAFGSQSLTYDANGNLLNDATYTYTWNARDQLVSMTGPGVNASFQYDATGSRISKTLNGTTTGYLYNGANIVQEQTGGAPSANILTGGLDEVFTRTDAGGTWGMFADGLGSTLGLTDSAGTVQTQYTYEPFGRTTTSDPSSSNASQYTGRENDGTSLYYYRGRYYSPSLQRFISEDPIGLLGGINLYAYVGNDPISYTDPFGLKPGNPGDDPGNPRDDPGNDGDDIEKALRDFVDAVKDWINTVIWGASMEALGPALAAGLPTLRVLHTDSLSARNLDRIRRMSTADIIESLRPGNTMGTDPLIVNSAGTIMQGNHRVTVLMERGVDVNTLPRVPYP